jgi:hypothetical protein
MINTFRAAAGLLVLAIATAWTAEPGPGAEPASAGSDRAAIRAHIDRIFKAYIAADRAEVRATHDREWRGFLTGSHGIIRGIDEYMRGAGAALASPQKLRGYTMDDFDVQFRGSSLAVVPYVATLEGEHAGAPVRWKLRVIDVYERQEGEWMQVASNTSLHPQSVLEQSSELQPLSPSERAELLDARERVWRAWFGGDEAALRELLPPETMALAPGPEAWMSRDSILNASADFVRGGGRLVRLEFPRTEIQTYGATAILYTSYLFETDSGGKRIVERGKAIEVFVRRQHGWVNSGWHMSRDS